MIMRLGIYSLLAGFFLGIFSGISNFMTTNNFWSDLTISKMIGEDKSEAVILLMDAAVIQDSLDFFIYELPFFSILLGLGLVLLIISLFIKSH